MDNTNTPPPIRMAHNLDEDHKTWIIGAQLAVMITDR